jgi:hypothetical protein
MTDQSALMTIVVPCKEFTNIMNDMIQTSFFLHSSLAAHVTAVLAKHIESLNKYECVVLAVFA